MTCKDAPLLVLLLLAGMVQGLITGGDLSKYPTLFTGLVATLFATTYSFATMVKLRRTRRKLISES